jgi:hypothetical protein
MTSCSSGEPVEKALEPHLDRLNGLRLSPICSHGEPALKVARLEPTEAKVKRLRPKLKVA